MADSSTTSSRLKPKGKFSCQRCRRRKQKCNREQPCDNCVQAQIVCVPSERLQRRSIITSQYTRSLENRILELEGQASEIPRLQRSESTEGSSVACHEERRSDTISSLHVSRPPQPASSPFVHSTSGTPITTQSSSSIFQNTPFIRNVKSMVDETSELMGSESVERSMSSQGLRFSHRRERSLLKTYLERVNPRYPFIYENNLMEWYSSWKNLQGFGDELPADEKWKSFFIHMAFAVSLLITAQVSPEERQLSNNAYSVALSSLGAVIERPDPVLHVQAYLMCTIHALHSPSSHTVLTTIATTMRCCVISQLHRAQYEPKVQNSSSFLQLQIRRRVFWSAYAIDRLISWIYHVPCSLMDENIHIELFANMNDNEIEQWQPRTRLQADVVSIPRQTQVSSALHLIRVRRIQSRILAIMMRSDYDTIFAPNYEWRLHMLKELDQWRNQLQPHSDPESRGYTSQGWVGMAYNYTVLLLHRPTKENVRGLVGVKCLQACADILSVFRQYQKDRQTAQLWPGLLSQFGIGITLLYCLWATPPSYRTNEYRSSEPLAAIRTCSVILAVFAEQWREAEPLRDLFDTLSASIPYHHLGVTGHSQNRFSANTASAIHAVWPHITSLVVNVDICRMINEMATEDYPGDEINTNDIIASWPSETHCPQTCYLCQDKTVTQNTPLPEAFDLHGPGGGPEDDIFAFPDLFGSVEF